MQNFSSKSYAEAGVDVKAGYETVERIKPLIESTSRPGVLGSFGGFGGLYEPNLAGMKRPVTVSGTDGVGTKLKIAFLMDKHDTIGIDCVAMCVNDIVCTGAQPHFFLDYLAMGKNKPQRTENIIKGVAEGCRIAGCALIGGETAEHPGMMPEDEYDIAGFSVGFVDYDDIIDGKTISPGDVIIGLASSGLHSNGFSLVRKILASELSALEAYMPELGCTLGEELLRPTRIYVKPLISVIKQFGKAVKGISNITGGGHYENIPRVLPGNIRARIDTSRFPTMPVFKLLAHKGSIPFDDMYNTFNMGVGMVLFVSQDKADVIKTALSDHGETPVFIGECFTGEKEVVLE